MAKPVAWTYVWKGEGISFKERQGLREGKACVEGVTLIVGRDDTHFVWSRCQRECAAGQSSVERSTDGTTVSACQ